MSKFESKTGQLVGIYGFALFALIYSGTGIASVAVEKKDEKTAHDLEIAKDISFYLMVIAIGLAIGSAGVGAV